MEKKKSFKGVMILNTAEIPTTPEDISDIDVKGCLHCGVAHDPVIPMTYVRLEHGELIWWHRTGSCPAERIPVENKIAII